MEISGDLPETMRKLCLSKKFPHQEITLFFVMLLSNIYYRELDVIFTEIINNKIFFKDL